MASRSASRYIIVRIVTLLSSYPQDTPPATCSGDFRPAASVLIEALHSLSLVLALVTPVVCSPCCAKQWRRRRPALRRYRGNLEQGRGCFRQTLHSLQPASPLPHWSSEYLHRA